MADGFRLTHFGNADRLVSRFGGRLRWCGAYRSWFVWTGLRWQPDRKDVMDRFCRSIVEGIWKQAAEMRGAIADDWAKWAHRCEDSKALDQMQRIARNRLAIEVRDLDKDDFVVNLANGNLILLPEGVVFTEGHEPEDLMTKVSPVEFDHHAECPTWERFLLWAMEGNQEMVDFLQKAVGYSMTGSVAEHCWFFCFGRGRNGKSTFLNVVRDMLGDYGLNAPADMFLRQKRDSSGAPVVALRGMRFVTCIDPDEGQSLDLGLIKRITGGDPIEGRPPYGREYVRFQPQAKIWLAANDKPSVRSTTDGTWDRVVLIPWLARVADDERDKDLPKKLRREWPGILAWAVEGAKRYFAEGLTPPALVRSHTDEYRSNQDYLGLFLEEETIAGDGGSVPKQRLYDRYRLWCEENGCRAMTKVSFGADLKTRGFEGCRTNTARFWTNLRLVPRTEDESVPF